MHISPIVLFLRICSEKGKKSEGDPLSLCIIKLFSLRSLYVGIVNAIK